MHAIATALEITNLVSNPSQDVAQLVGVRGDILQKEREQVDISKTIHKSEKTKVTTKGKGHLQGQRSPHTLYRERIYWNLP